MSEMTKSVTFHDFCEVLEEDEIQLDMMSLSQRKISEEDIYEDDEDEQTTRSLHTSSSTKQRHTNRRGLPLNSSFSSWLQLFLSKKRRNPGIRVMRPSVSLCK